VMALLDLGSNWMWLHHPQRIDPLRPRLTLVIRARARADEARDTM
jgi:hypothetical protein